MKHISDGELLYNTLPRFLDLDLVICYIEVMGVLDLRNLQEVVAEILSIDAYAADQFVHGMEIAISHTQFEHLTVALAAYPVGLSSVFYLSKTR